MTDNIRALHEKNNVDDNVVPLHAPKVPNGPDDVLERCKGNMESTLVIGYDKDGMLVFNCSDGLLLKDLSWMVGVFANSLHTGKYSA